MQRIEQPRRRLGQITRRAQIIVARDRPEPDSELLVRERRRPQPHRLARRIMAREHPRRDDLRSLDPAHGEPARRSEEHTSELQSLMRIPYAVFCWKKKHHKQGTSVVSTSNTEIH